MDEREKEQEQTEGTLRKYKINSHLTGLMKEW